MTLISEEPFLSGKRNLTPRLVDHGQADLTAKFAVPFYQGAFGIGSRNGPQFGNPTSFLGNPFYLRRDSADGEHLITASESYTVGPGQSFASLSEALRTVTNRRNQTNVVNPVSITLTIASGTVIAETLAVDDVDLSHVTITAVDQYVTVDLALAAPGAVSGNTVSFIQGRNARLPSIRDVVFRPINKTAGVRYIGLSIAMNCEARVEGTINEGNENQSRLAGFERFTDNLRVQWNSRFFGSYLTFNDADNDGIIVIDAGQYMAYSATATGCGSNGIYVANSSQVYVHSGENETINGVRRADFRKTPGVTSSADIVAFAASVIFLPGDVQTLGGSNIDRNTYRSNKVILDGGGLTTTFAGHIDLNSYTVATLPSLGDERIVFVSDGDAGAPCLAVRTGNEWRRIVLGPAVSAS